MILLGGQGEGHLLTAMLAGAFVLEAHRRDEQPDMPQHLATLQSEPVTRPGSDQVLLRIRAQRHPSDQIRQ